MPAILGRVKTGGRLKGSPNKRSLSRSEQLKNRLEQIEFELGLNPGELDPIEGLARIAAKPTTPLDVKVDCLKSIAPYVYPKLTAVAVKNDDDGSDLRPEVVDIGRFLHDPSMVAAAQKIALAMQEEPEELHSGIQPLGLPSPEPEEVVMDGDDE